MSQLINRIPFDNFLKEWKKTDASTQPDLWLKWARKIGLETEFQGKKTTEQLSFEEDQLTVVAASFDVRGYNPSKWDGYEPVLFDQMEDNFYRNLGMTTMSYLVHYGIPQAILFVEHERVAHLTPDYNGTQYVHFAHLLYEYDFGYGRNTWTREYTPEEIERLANGFPVK